VSIPTSNAAGQRTRKTADLKVAATTAVFWTEFVAAGFSPAFSPRNKNADLKVAATTAPF